MRRLLVVLAAAVAALAAITGASAAPVFVITGHGWGHGIGMSQYGAYGYALHGWSHDRILAHYYRGTAKGTTRNVRIRVLLDSGRSAVRLASPTAWRVDAANGSWRMSAGSRTITKRLKVKAAGKVRRLAPPVRFTALNGGRLAVDGRKYRGSIVLRKTGSLSIVNRVRLESYLGGVVPWEMPSGWAVEALKTQAVAARSYALAGKSDHGSYDLYDDTRSQVYGGVAAEVPSTNAAVKATAGEIRTYAGSVATTFFFSSSGGRTASNEDVWGGQPIPYLRSVSDPYDAAGGNPRHNWSLAPFSRKALAAELGSRVAGKLRDVRLGVNPSRRVGVVTTVGSRGKRSLTGWDFRSLLTLNSTWFRVGVLKIRPVPASAPKGRRIALAGLARGAASAWLERRRSGGAWARVRDLKLSDAGAFRTRVSPTQTTSYRVRARRFWGVTLAAPAASRARTIRVAARPALVRKPAP